MMLFHFPFMLTALALCLLLSGMLSFFGYHVVRRGVIFVDLSLAQVAALGSSVGLLLGYGEQSPFANYTISLSFTLLGAVMFSFFRKQKKAPIEALIGITYAGAMALSLIVLEKSATGTEELKEMLVGALLTVAPKTVLVIAGLFVCLGFLLFAARKPLFLITEQPEEAERKGLKVWGWDFLFYMAFGLVVTSSVRVSGVLLVFAFLIVPSLSAVIAVKGMGKSLIFSWCFGLIGCVLGLELSLRMDWPAGPSIVTVFITLLLLTGIANIFRK